MLHFENLKLFITNGTVLKQLIISDLLFPLHLPEISFGSKHLNVVEYIVKKHF